MFPLGASVHRKQTFLMLQAGLLPRRFIFKSQLGYIFEGLGIENVGIFMTIWEILRPFGKF
jgi:hypothetical protein